jgi:hypothetical protein
MKKQKEKKLFSILIVVDDFSDDPSFSRQSKLLHSLYTRGRHNSISSITATQKFGFLYKLFVQFVLLVAIGNPADLNRSAACAATA